MEAVEIFSCLKMAAELQQFFGLKDSSEGCLLGMHSNVWEFDKIRSFVL